MKARPILFKAEMVRAILDGRKTQTRRLVSDRNSRGNWKASQLDLARAWVDPGPSPAGNPGPYLKSYLRPEVEKEKGHRPDSITDRLYPWVFAGDRLWVKETWRAEELPAAPYTDGIRFAADQAFVPIQNTPEAAYAWVEAFDNGRHGKNWRPSIFMPRWASRITLEVTGVRVERVQDISEEDAKAEGATGPVRKRIGPGFGTVDYRQAFQRLWGSINGAEPWAANPWVWVIDFKPTPAPGSGVGK